MAISSLRPATQIATARTPDIITRSTDGYATRRMHSHTLGPSITNLKNSQGFSHTPLVPICCHSRLKCKDANSLRIRSPFVGTRSKGFGVLLMAVRLRGRLYEFMKQTNRSHRFNVWGGGSRSGKPAHQAAHFLRGYRHGIEAIRSKLNKENSRMVQCSQIPTDCRASDIVPLQRHPNVVRQRLLHGI